MPIEVLVPSALSVATNWTDIGAGNLGSSANTTLATTRPDPNSTNELRYALTNLPTIAHDVLSVKAQWRRASPDNGGGGGTNQGDFNIYLGGSLTNVESLVSTPVSPTLSALIGPLARPGGGSWSVADANALETHNTADRPMDHAGDGFSIFYLGVHVDYFVPTGFFVYLITAALGPLSGVAWWEMPKVARAFAKATRGKTILRGDELRRAWKSLNAPRPKYAF